MVRVCSQPPDLEGPDPSRLREKYDVGQSGWRPRVYNRPTDNGLIGPKA